MSKPEVESEQECIKELAGIAQKLSTLDENNGAVCLEWRIKITNLMIELSMKQFIHNARLGYHKKELDTRFRG
jgi:hypothetical protein